jgi:ubiquinol-cytochrome c reductase core subunit 2
VSVRTDFADVRDHFLELLASVLSSTQYHQHEYAELVLPTIENESVAAMASPSIQALDIAHALAFRRGLGNSLFASAHAPITAADVKSYAQHAYAKSNIAVLGAGMTSETLSAAVKKAFGAGSGAGGLSTPPVKYSGGEQRVPIDYHVAPQAQPTLLIAYGTESAPSADLKVLPHLLGGQASIKWTTGTSPLSLIASKVPGAKAEAFLLPYTDAGLFGVMITAPTNEGLKSIASEVAKQIKSVTSVKDEELKKAVAKAKFADATSMSTSMETLLSIAGPAVS